VNLPEEVVETKIETETITPSPIAEKLKSKLC
jgi:hypothetical protein